MNEQELSGLIRALPRTSASPSFDREVTRKLGAVEHRETRPAWRLAAAFAVVAFLLLGVQFAVIRHAESERMEALRAEQQELKAELEAVKQLAQDAEPVVVLENDEGMRVILDAGSSVHSASLRNYD